MRVGLYSECARKDVVAAQLQVARRGYAATPEGIRTARQEIFRTAEGSGISRVLQIKDFYTMAETRDLLFHVQEKRFNLLEIADLLRETGLKFIGFELSNNDIRTRYLKCFSDDPTAISLENWNQYELENPDAFMSLYLFWVQR